MKVLVVDDQEAVRTALELLFSVNGIECLSAASPARALEYARTEEVGVVVQDMNFTRDTTSGEEGKELFLKLRELDPDLPIILLTAWTSLESAVELIKEGATDYLAKPWDDAKLTLSVKNLLALREAQQENYALKAREDRGREDLAKRFDLRGLVYRSRSVHELISLAVHIAPADVAVLITGPGGSGKERVAEIIQVNSRRRGKPFVRVNAGAFPDQLLEAELFGAEPGAYTGASKLRIGRFESADGGTLFLDEIGNLSATGQMRLLRVLQTGEFERLGSSVTRKVDIRVISATNADLQSAIAAGRFREDLYFRLNVIELTFEPLSRRREDIAPLAQHFLELYRGEADRQLGAEALLALEHHDWPGNVRELENKIRRACLVAASAVIGPSDLDLDGRSSIHATDSKARKTSEADTSPPSVANAEREAVEAALARASGVISRAAAELGLSRQALYRRMERLGLEIERRIR